MSAESRMSYVYIYTCPDRLLSDWVANGVSITTNPIDWMRTKMALETLLLYGHLTWLIACEDFIEIEITCIVRKCLKAEVLSDYFSNGGAAEVDTTCLCYRINKKIPRGPPSPPAPVMHSPTRKVC
jgi:hypothetical protein